MKLPNFNVDGKVALVTGANRGLGRGIALTLAHAGADLVLADCSDELLDDLSREIVAAGKKALIQRVDISKEEEVIAMTQAALEAFNRIDILVNNAAIAHRIPAVETTLEQLNQTFAVNLTGTFLCGREIGKAMIRQKKGKIINLASINCAVARPNLSAYGASKAGVMQLTRCWALEWAPHHINVNAVAPSFIRTPMMEDYLKDKAVHDQLVGNVPLGRIGTIEDMAAAVLFLASEASDYITGHTLFVDGGWVAQ